MTPEEILKEKERLKLQEEEEQLMLAQELMGKCSYTVIHVQKNCSHVKECTSM